MKSKSNHPRLPFAVIVRLNTDRVANPAAAGIEHITPED